MIRKLVLLIVLLPFFCSGQKNRQQNQNNINYNDIVDINGLIYFKTDTTLVTGRVISYNKKRLAKKYVFVSKGKPDNLGWVYFNDKTEMPKESVLGDILLTGAYITGAVMAVTGNDVYLPINDSENRIATKSQLNSYISEQKDETSKAYADMLVKNEISSHINTAKEISNGLFQEYYDNGQLKSEGNYIEGKEDGLWEEYYYNGRLLTKVNYINGKKFGVLENYYSSGQLKSRINYKEGKENGMMELYHENGELMLKGLSKDAMQTGEWKYYNENGELIKTENFN